MWGVGFWDAKLNKEKWASLQCACLHFYFLQVSLGKLKEDHLDLTIWHKQDVHNEDV